MTLSSLLEFLDERADADAASSDQIAAVHSLLALAAEQAPGGGVYLRLLKQAARLVGDSWPASSV